MKEVKLKLLDNIIANESGKTHILKFETPEIEAFPGQFVNIAVEGVYLRRPISVSEYDSEKGILTLVIDKVGKGTAELCAAKSGDHFDMLTGLGKGFSLNPPGKNILLLAGGVGFAPMIGLQKALSKKDYNVKAVFGFNDISDIPFCLFDGMVELGLDVTVATMTGTCGFKGNAIEATKEVMTVRSFVPDYFYACGPMPMMNAACREFDHPGELSLEARMGCGFGACMGCSIKTADGIARICKEGPVFEKRQLLIN